MQYVFLCVPIFTDDKKALRKRRKAFNSWKLGPQGTSKLEAKLGRQRLVSFFRFGPGSKLNLPDAAGKRGVVVSVGKGVRLGKGLAVRLHLIQSLTIVDSRDAAFRSHAYYVMIDGTGAFLLDNVHLVFDRLQARDMPDVVLGLRAA